ncbi:cytochrome C family protein [Thermodesulfatator indicus DSM 15286]|uniref:Cytochrome C family protein n=1 Tax=Thermodesulfatator indicus (strain DSM 15286 / JCM 11887 / CIR29812) TaxID=667014 RepID=F8AAD4_THEID|nr:cytochrome c3 family protein [Thermodesulfatator indicus]AEH44273.1 cytochrome C family protein [Thermodesulfatator indicus DSM 15286]
MFYLILFLLINFLAGNVWAVTLKPSPTRECAICHFRWMEPFYYEHRGTPLHPLQVEKVAGDEMMCFSCHDGSNEDSRVKVWLRDRHKVNIKPSDKVRIPKIFPLSPDGKIVCCTCHSAHGVPTDTSIERVIFLRISNKDSIMCELCHVRQTKKDRNHPMHKGDRPIPKKLVEAGAVLSVTNPKHIICESCHTAHGGTEKNFILPISDSSLCSACHEEKYRETEPQRPRRKNHPLFVKFHEKHGAPKLFAGKKGTVQCSSCHKAHQPDAPQKPFKLLAAPIFDSQLCLICHNEKGTPVKNHPVKITFKLPEKSRLKFFVGPKGTLQCLTCHGIHQKKSFPKSLVAEYNPLCSSCHPKAFLVEKTEHDLRVTAPEEKNILGEDVKTGGLCSPCHVPHNATGPYLWARKLDVKEAYPSDLCLTCHNKEAIASKKLVGEETHPIKIVMKNPPKDLPFYKVGDKKDLLECSTCHNPHQWAPNKKKKGPGKNTEGTPLTSFLRKPAGLNPVLCGTCHQNQLLVEKTEHDLRVTAPEEKNILGEDVKTGGLCSPCHVPHNATGPYLWARKLDVKEAYPSDLCLTCHNKEAIASKKLVGEETHPIKIVMKNPPKDLPFYKVGDKKDLLECSTCHNPHQWAPNKKKKGPGKNTEGTEMSSFLRKPNLKYPKLCGTCHHDQAFVTGTDHDLRVTAPQYVNLQGKSIKDASPCTACHGVHNALYEPYLWVAPLGNGQDYIEKTCYGCHSKDGPAADKTVPVGSHPTKLYFGYHKKYLSLLIAKYVPLFTLDGKRSPQGVITCSTCHDPHIWDDNNPEQAPWKNVEGNVMNSFLRKRLDLMENFCSICHGPSALFLYRYYHDAEMREELHRREIPLIQR